MKKLMLLPIVALSLAACTGGGYQMTPTQKAALTGAAVGAGVGAVANSNNRGKGALIGAAAGGVIGGVGAEYGKDQAQPRQPAPQYY